MQVTAPQDSPLAKSSAKNAPCNHSPFFFNSNVILLVNRMDLSKEGQLVLGGGVSSLRALFYTHLWSLRSPPAPCDGLARWRHSCPPAVCISFSPCGRSTVRRTAGEESDGLLCLFYGAAHFIRCTPASYTLPFCISNH